MPASGVDRRIASSGRQPGTAFFFHPAGHEQRGQGRPNALGLVENKSGDELPHSQSPLGAPLECDSSVPLSFSTRSNNDDTAAHLETTDQLGSVEQVRKTKGSNLASLPGSRPGTGPWQGVPNHRTGQRFAQISASMPSTIRARVVALSAKSCRPKPEENPGSRSVKNSPSITMSWRSVMPKPPSLPWKPKIGWCHGRPRIPLCGHLGQSRPSGYRLGMYQSLLLPDLRVMLQEQDTQGLHEFCEVLHPAIAAETLEGLASEEIWQVLSCCDLPHQVEIFEFIGLPKQLELVDAVERERLSRLLEAMSPDNRADLFARLDSERVENLLPLIAKAERADIRKLLSYPADSAGSIMTTEYAFLPEGATVSEALQQLRRQAPDRETIYYIYVVDEGRHLKGFVSLRDLILARPITHVAEIMTRDVISVRVDDDQEHAAQQLDRYDFLAIPVVDNQNRLVGIITYDDVLDVLQEEATEDVHRLGGMAPLEDSYLATPIRTIAWKRGIWLMVLAGLALVTARLVEAYEQQAQSHVWLVSFLPLVLASGGNAGSQSATLVIRAGPGGIDATSQVLVAAVRVPHRNWPGRGTRPGRLLRCRIFARTVTGLGRCHGRVPGGHSGSGHRCHAAPGIQTSGDGSGYHVQPADCRHVRCVGRGHLFQRRRHAAA